MKYLFCGMFYIIIRSYVLVEAFFIVLWHFELNPVLERGSKNGYYYEPWDYKLSHKIMDKRRPEHDGVK